MAVVGRIFGFLIGGVLGVIGFFYWMLSNDGVGDERVMKVLGGAGMILGLTLCLIALLWKGSKKKAGHETGPE